MKHDVALAINIPRGEYIYSTVGSFGFNILMINKKSFQRITLIYFVIIDVYMAIMPEQNIG